MSSGWVQSTHGSMCICFCLYLCVIQCVFHIYIICCQLPQCLYVCNSFIVGCFLWLCTLVNGLSVWKVPSMCWYICAQLSEIIPARKQKLTSHRCPFPVPLTALSFNVIIIFISTVTVTVMLMLDDSLLLNLHHLHSNCDHRHEKGKVYIAIIIIIIPNKIIATIITITIIIIITITTFKILRQQNPNIRQVRAFIDPILLWGFTIYYSWSWWWWWWWWLL